MLRLISTLHFEPHPTSNNSDARAATWSTGLKDTKEKSRKADKLVIL